jgi:hypothetical protein
VLAGQAAVAGPHLGATSATPPVPTSTIKAVHQTSVTYCVENYAFNSTVHVVNQHNGATGTITTDSKGSGCTDIAIDRACDQTVSQTIVATGTDQAGKPASSQATENAPPDPSLCHSPSPSPSPSSRGNSCDHAHLSQSVVVQGQSVRATGCGFIAGEQVDFYVHSAATYVGSATANDQGVASLTFTVSDTITPGHHTVELIGQQSGQVDTAPLEVKSAGQVRSGGGTVPLGHGSGSGSGSGSGGGSLAFTGADILAMVLIGLVAIGLGTLAVVTARRRRAAPAA